MTPRTVRRLVIVTCVGGIAGMIAGSIADNNAIAMTFGLLTAVAVLCLIVVTAVTRPADPAEVEAAGAAVEARIAELVEDGVPEGRLRDLVRAAVDLGRGARQTERNGA
jgi:hypothetical protein